MQIAILGFYVGRFLNKSYTLEKNHDLQIEHIKDLSDLDFNIPTKTMEIINEIENIESIA